MFSDSMCQNTSADEQIISSTSFGCPGGPENSDSWLCGPFSAKNILTLDVDKKHWPRRGHKSANYWLAENGKAGEEQGFIMSLGCNKRVAGVNIRNTQDAYDRDRSTKKLRILGSVAYDGPWQELLVANLEDSRHQDPPPLQQLMFYNSAVVSFIKFELLEYYGNGGGIQYFAVGKTKCQSELKSLFGGVAKILAACRIYLRDLTDIYFELRDTKIYMLLKKQTIHTCNNGLTAGGKLRSFSINNMLCAQKYLVVVRSKKS